MRWGSVRVVEIEIIGYQTIQGDSDVLAGGGAVESQMDRVDRGSANRNKNLIRLGVASSYEVDARAPMLCQCEPAEGVSPQERGQWQVDGSEQFARLQDVRVVTGNEVDRRHKSAALVQCEDLVLGVKRRTHHHHRPGGQGGTDISPDGLPVPDFETGEILLDTLPQEWPGAPVVGWLEFMQLGYPAGSRNLQAGRTHGKARPAGLRQVAQSAQVRHWRTE